SSAGSSSSRTSRFPPIRWGWPVPWQARLGSSRNICCRSFAIGGSGAGAALLLSSSGTWRPWPRRRDTWTNFSSELSDEALVVVRPPAARPGALCGRLRLQSDPDPGRTGQPGPGTDPDAAPAASGPDSESGEHGEGGHQAGGHG